MKPVQEPKLLRSELILKARKFNVVREEFALPQGGTVTREYLKHPGAVVILPQEADGRLVLLRQYRYALGKTIWEFPAGTLDSGENVESTARRELREEVGLEARSWVRLGSHYAAPGVSDEMLITFLAHELADVGAQPEQGELIEIERRSVTEVRRMITDGELLDGKSIVAFHFALERHAI